MLQGSSLALFSVCSFAPSSYILISSLQELAVHTSPHIIDPGLSFSSYQSLGSFTALIIANSALTHSSSSSSLGLAAPLWGLVRFNTEAVCSIHTFSRSGLSDLVYSPSLPIPLSIVPRAYVLHYIMSVCLICSSPLFIRQI